ncbi:MAG: hypothetical protein ACJAS1_001602 [Oleiphilaceae bacterium]
MIRIDKKDYLRALLTDTAPADVPLIFSNDGLYVNLKNKSNENIKTIFSIISKKNSTIPYKYKIYKNEVKMRTLSLVHPSSQRNYAEFYNDHSHTINYLCSRSEFSIRAPYKAVNSAYVRNGKRDKPKKYKEFKVETIDTELGEKHAASYFAYKGHNRIYKFFQSKKYFELEKKFKVMWKLDVANCFDSIYTHTICWAIKGKQYTKDNLKKGAQFGDRFDSLLQNSNHSETNGLPIGSEVSRIFSEIIFQRIDTDIQSDLIDLGLLRRIDYEIIRYVDDFVLFSDSNDSNEIIKNIISSRLSNYNLYLNEVKLEKYVRPFNTSKSRLINLVNERIGDLEKLLYVKDRDDYFSVIPNKINRRERLVFSIVSKIKGDCISVSSGYSDMAPYFIGIISKRVITFTQKVKVLSLSTKDGMQHNNNIKNVIAAMFDLLFFFYAVSPSVSSSLKVSKSIIIASDFFCSKLEIHEQFIKSEIMAHVSSLELSLNFSGRHVSLENLNIISAVANFGDEFLLSSEVFEEIVRHDISYFEIVSLLYYFKDREVFGVKKVKLLAKIRLKLNSIGLISAD